MKYENHQDNDRYASTANGKKTFSRLPHLLPV
jgi:hypothetical protein